MLKYYFFIIIAIAVTIAVTHASESSVAYNGQTVASLDLHSTQSHTEYTYETVWDTCSRQILDGYRRVCEKQLIEKRRICRMINGHAVCTDEGDGDNDDHDDHHGDDHTTYCHDEPYYRTEYYTCERIVAHPHYVFDYSTLAKVDVRFGAWPSDAGTPTAKIDVDLSDAGFLSSSAENKSDKPVLIYGHWSGEVRQGNDTARELFSILNISFISAEKILAPIKSELEDLKFEQKTLSFLVNEGNSPSDINLNLKVKKIRWFILKDKEVFNSKLTLGQFKVLPEGRKWRIVIPLETLVQFETGKKYSFEFNLGLVEGIKNNLLNETQIHSKPVVGKLKTKF